MLRTKTEERGEGRIHGSKANRGEGTKKKRVRTARVEQRTMRNSGDEIGEDLSP